MRLSDPRVIEILLWWREQPFWNKCLFAIFHPNEWMCVVCIDRADKKVRREMYDRIFGR